MSSDKYKNYLRDLGVITKEYAREAIENYSAAKGTEDGDFEAGYMMGLERIVSLMQQQADVFEIPLSEIGLDDINESDFLNASAQKHK